MKLPCVAALASIPASLAFAPVRPQSPAFRTDSSLNSFLSDLFNTRSANSEDQQKFIVDRFHETINSVNESDSSEPAGEGVGQSVEGSIRHMPTKKMTGVEPHICRLAATMAKQCYDIQNEELDTFQLSTKKHKTETIILTKQGVFRPTSPTFGAAVCGDTMILAWRGTSPKGAPMDVINDVALSPCSSGLWRAHAKSIKLQGAMTSLCANDIANYEEKIIAECKKRGIKEIVTTGHSLGAGIGQCAHTILRAQIQDESSPWSELNGDVNVRSMVFSAPMTTLVLDNFTPETEKFVEEINENSCNLIFSNDVVPRAYGYLSFIEEFVDEASRSLTKSITAKLPLGFLYNGRLSNFVFHKEEAVVNNKLVGDLVGVMCQYIHPGKIVYYETGKSKPRVLTDMGFAYDGPKKDTFRSVKYKKGLFKKSKSVVEAATGAWHMTTVQTPGIPYGKSDLLIEKAPEFV